MADAVILYVEDEVAIREEMADILGLEYDTVYLAKNGEEGLRMYRELQPDIVISDVQMPVMDGITMCQQIKLLDPHSKIILTTAYNEAVFVENAKAIGINRYVTKPISIDTLFREIETCLNA